MSFRETSAWISVISILAVFGFYFAVVAQAIETEPEPSAFLGEYIGAVVLLVVVQVTLGIIAAIATRASVAELEAARDEREKLMELKANRFDYAILLAGAVLVAGAIGLGAPRYWTANALVFSVALGEFTRFGAQIVYYRLGV